MMAARMKQFNTTMPQQYIDMLTEEHRLTGKRRSEVIRQALDMYFERKEKIVGPSVIQID